MMLTFSYSKLNNECSYQTIGLVIEWCKLLCLYCLWSSNNTLEGHMGDRGEGHTHDVGESAKMDPGIVQQPSLKAQKLPH